MVLQLQGMHASGIFSAEVQISFSPAAFAFLHTTHDDTSLELRNSPRRNSSNNIIFIYVHMCLTWYS